MSIQSKISTLAERVRLLEASSKKDTLYKLIQEYNDLVGIRRRPNKDYIQEQDELGLLDEAIYRVEQAIQQALVDRDL